MIIETIAINNSEFYISIFSFDITWLYVYPEIFLYVSVSFEFQKNLGPHRDENVYECYYIEKTLEVK